MRECAHAQADTPPAQGLPGSHPQSEQTAPRTRIQTPTRTPQAGVRERGELWEEGLLLLPETADPKPRAFPPGGAGSSLPPYLPKVL